MPKAQETAVYTHGHHESVLRSHTWPAARRDDGQRGVQGVAHRRGGEGRRDQRGGPHGAVDAVAGVREDRVPAGQTSGPDGIAGAGPAVDVGADQRPDPLLVRVVVRRRERRFEPVGEVAVSGPFRRERLQVRQPQQPQVADLLGAEAEAVRLQQVQAEDRVVHVVVPAAAVDPAAHAAAPLRAQHGGLGRVGGLGEVVGQRQGRRPAQIAVDAVTGPHLALLDRLAEHVARDPAEPAAVDTVGEVPSGALGVHDRGVPVLPGGSQRLPRVRAGHDGGGVLRLSSQRRDWPRRARGPESKGNTRWRTLQ